MIAEVSAAQLAGFFAYAPLVLGIAIVAVAWAAKRHEGVPATANAGTTFACSGCGRRGSREHMLPQTHEGAVSWYCAKCAGAH